VQQHVAAGQPQAHLPLPELLQQQSSLRSKLVYSGCMTRIIFIAQGLLQHLVDAQQEIT